ncbi:MAG TPA: DinB family protein [Ohtaekwangia sp.]|uniref:DinB family protein n=1 Tax=Ohtaekwangia sp. TaxID=2066019 RepID=UPI002F95F13E
MKNNEIETKEHVVITPENLLEHWQGHRRVTRRVIEAFPEDKFFNYSVGGMRPFADMVMEMLGMAVPGLEGLITGKWVSGEEANALFSKRAPSTRAEVLRLWDETTDKINELWPQIPPPRFQEVDVAFGQYEAPMHFIVFYWIDNEIHHRGQAYVYLRSLGIAPPPFWDRN